MTMTAVGLRIQPDWSCQNQDTFWVVYESSGAHDTSGTTDEKAWIRIEEEHEADNSRRFQAKIIENGDKFEARIVQQPSPLKSAILEVQYVPREISTEFIAPCRQIGSSKMILCCDATEDGQIISTGHAGGYAAIIKYTDILRHSSQGGSTNGQQDRTSDSLINDCVQKQPDIAGIHWSFDVKHVLLVGHFADVNAVKLLVGGKAVATASSDMCVRVWDTKTGHCGAILKGHAGGVLCLASIDKGKQLVSGGRDATIRKWTVHNAENVSTIQCEAPVTGLSLSQSQASHSDSPDVGFATCEDGKVVIWDVEQNVVLNKILASRPVEDKSIGLNAVCNFQGLFCFGGEDGKVSVLDSSELGPASVTSLESANFITFCAPVRGIGIMPSPNSIGISICVSLENGWIHLVEYCPKDHRLRLLGQLTGSNIDPVHGLYTVTVSDTYQIFSGSNDGVLRYYSLSMH